MVDLLNEIRGDVKDGLKLDSVSLVSLSQINPEVLEEENITQTELKVIQFFLTNGQEILNQYIKIILDTPPRSVIDYHIDVFTSFCHTFRQGSNTQDTNTSNQWLT